MALDKRFIFMLASAQMQVAGSMVKQLDADTVGRDDVIGKVLESGGRAIGALSVGDFKKVDLYLKTIADALNDYLAQADPPTTS